MSGWIRRNAAVVAGLAAVLMLSAWLVGCIAVFAAHLGLSNLVLWPADASFVVCGWILAVRRRTNAVGWLLLITALGMTLLLPGTALSSWMLRDGVGLGRWTGSLSTSAFVFLVGGLALLLPLMFPDGRLPSARRWWRVVLIADVLYMVLASANLFDASKVDLPGGIKSPNPFALPHEKTLVGILISLCVPCLLTGFVGSFSALVVRWRSAGEAQRAQMKWVVLALLTAPWPFILHDTWSAASNVAMTIVLPLVPVAIVVSVLRYRLYEIDRVLSRTVSYLLVTGLLIGVYVGAVALTDHVLGFSSSVAVAASTLAAAALFRPLLRRVQRSIDRRFNRERYDAARTVEAFAVRLRDEVDADLVRTDLLAVAANAMQPATMSLWLPT
ncbi:MAG TPA: hypothetical protein VFH54_09110 [Mycobacteriales bacterium]|nr:hypothetical protein [Mycobacteriales bacterium]